MSDYAGQRYLIVGLGASGRSALRYLARAGAQLAATDSRPQPDGLADLQQAHPDVEFRVGGFGAPLPLGQFREAVVSPGISPDQPFVRSLREAGVNIVGDIELFARAARAPVVAITGSNGKSTTTALLGEMAQAAGLRVGVGGNIGTPALDLLSDAAQLYVLELSSFQLETTGSLRCAAAAILNLSPDHLDRHGSMEAYGAAKARVLQNCGTAVLNREDAAVMALGRAGPGYARLRTFGLSAPGSDEYGLIEQDGQRWLAAPEAVCRAADLRIQGTHNAANALAALALADAAGIARAASVRALHRFPGLPHRCQFVAEVDGVAYINDSKGTNVGSTLAALTGLPAPIVWLGGGQGKGQRFAELREPLACKGRAAVLFGEDADAIERDVLGALPVYREPDLRAALRRARELAQRGDRVLLSPACASFDQFRDYVDRGDKFCAAVRELAA